MKPKTLFSVAIWIGFAGLFAYAQTAAPPAAKPAVRKPASQVDSVIQMVKAGISEGIIIKTLQKNSKAIDLTAADLIKLKEAGASDNLIAFMMDPTATPAPQPAITPPPPAPDPVTPPPAPVAQVSPKTASIGDWRAAIQERLEQQFPLTQATADKSDIVTAGAVLILKKNGLAMYTSAAFTNMNTYKNGNITQGILGKLSKNATDGSTRTFVRGEKFRVTQIDVKDDGVVFRFLSDPLPDTRYSGALKFPFPKGSPPTADQIAATVAEVLKVEDSELPAPPAKGNPAAPPMPSTQSLAPVAPGLGDAQSGPGAVQEIGDWDSRYGRMTNDDLERINDPTVRFDLNYLRLNPAALDQKPVMQYFVALNNCNHRDVERALFNELDYPALAAFYRAKAAQILASLPRTITDVSFDRFIGGHKEGNWMLWSQSLSLGDYDPQRRVFPLRYPGKDVVEIPDSLSTDSSNRNLGQTCPAAQKAASAVHSYLPSKYEIAVRPAAYRELPMDEVSARQYIDGAGSQRAVFLAVDVAILDSAPNVDRGKNLIVKATFRAQVLRLRVIDSRTQKPLGPLFDDGSLRPDAQVAQTPSAPAAPASKSGPGNWSFSDHMYDIRMSVYVSLAADACGWPLTAEQGANLKRFLDQVSNRGNFNERYQHSVAHTKVKNAISAQGRMNYCANPTERRDFNKYAAMVAPLGPLAASGAK